MSIIHVSNVSFSYEGSHHTVFDRVTFQIDSNWRLGLIGENGSGKTTLLRLFMGEYSYSGNIASSVAFSYFPYEVKNPEERTEKILDTLCPACQSWEIERELSLLDLNESVLARAFQSLSGGEQTKILLAALFLRENQFLLIDEPTNHLDQAARDSIAAYLQRKKGFILVSHDRSLLDQCVNHVLAIQEEGIEVQHGNYSTWRENQLRREQFRQRERERLEKEVGRLEEASSRAVRWSNHAEKSKKGVAKSGLKADRGYVGHKAAKMMKRAKSIEQRQEKALEEASVLLKNMERKQEIKARPMKPQAGVLAEIRDLSISYGDEPLFRPVHLQIEAGDRFSLSGKNGSGKSSLLKLLSGERLRYSGSIHFARDVKISYVEQDSRMLKGSLDSYAARFDIDRTLFRTILRKFGFARSQFDMEISSYSDGQKKKVLLARSLCEKGQLYLWDEPFNFIDIPARLQIEEWILDYRPTMVFVEHDKIFCESIATRELCLEEAGMGSRPKREK